MACDANKLSIKIYFMVDACRSYLYCNSSLHFAAILSNKVSLCQVFKKCIFVYTYYLMILMCTYTLEAEIPSSKLNWPMPAKHRNLSQGSLWSSHPSPPPPPTKKRWSLPQETFVSCFVCSHCSMTIHGLTRVWLDSLWGQNCWALRKEGSGKPKTMAFSSWPWWDYISQVVKWVYILLKIFTILYILGYCRLVVIRKPMNPSRWLVLNKVMWKAQQKLENKGRNDH